MNDLVRSGAQRIDWVAKHMPVLNALTEEREAAQPLAGLRLAMSIHLEAKTAYLALCLSRLGAQVAASGSNPLSTRDNICAALRDRGLMVNAHYGETEEEYEAHLRQTLSIHPQVILDDGGDLVGLLTGEAKEYADQLKGGCEETTTGVFRLHQLARKGQLPFPMIDVNGANMKHFFDNRYGTGQSVMDAITRTTNLIIASKVVVVAGYGWCGRGIAMRAAGLGARVIVTEVDPFKANEAVMDGFVVLPMDEAAKLGDIFVTATGCAGVIVERHFASMRPGAMLCNAGHFDVEVDVKGLGEFARSHRTVRDNIEEYTLPDGKLIYLLGMGRLVNLAAGDGHPAEIMDLSFSLQLLSIERMWTGAPLAPGVHDVPKEVDERVARMKLQTLGVRIDELTAEQHAYLGI